MNWSTIDPQILTLARRVLTTNEYEAWVLSANGAGYNRVALALSISPSTARDRIRRARRMLAIALDD